MACSIKIGSTSDIHFGHPRTPTSHIVTSFLEAFPDNAQTAELDMIFLCGDVFDRLLTVPEADHAIARVGIAKFLMRCEKYSIILIIEEGTPRHDRKQSYMFQELVELMGLNVELHYMDGCQILNIEKHGINILCIQDEYRHDPNETLAEVRQLMAERMLTKVDFAIMHGQFEYQLPDIDNARHKCHNAEAYLSLVEHQIFIGHDHHYSEFSLPEYTSGIVAHGSLDRLSHGEEEPKGHIRLTLDAEGNKSLVFVENKLAMDYRTIEVYDLPSDEVISLIRALKLRPGSHIRLKGTVFDMGVRMIRHLRKDFPEYKLSPLPEKDKRTDAPAPIVERTYIPVQISKENATGMVKDWLARKGFPPAEIKDCEDYLNEQINKGIGLKGAGSVPDFNGNVFGD